MSNPVADAARQEVSRLKMAILATEAADLFKDYLRAQQVILLYEADAIPAPFANAVRRMAPRAEIEPQSDSEAGRVMAAAKTYLEKIQRRAASGEITEVIVKSGIKIGGDEKGWASRVSAHLSSARARQIFDNVKGKGYGLRSATYAEPNLLRPVNGAEAR